MMQAMDDGGVCDITSPFSDESHKEMALGLFGYRM
jgi:hypothetical protein